MGTMFLLQKFRYRTSVEINNLISMTSATKSQRHEEMIMSLIKNDIYELYNNLGGLVSLWLNYYPYYCLLYFFLMLVSCFNGQMTTFNEPSPNVSRETFIHL